MAIQKAYLEVLQGAGKGTKVDVHFNPQSLQVTYQSYGPRGKQQKDNQGLKQGTTQQQTGSIADLSMDLLFDTTEAGTEVRNITIKIANMLRPNSENGQSSPDVPLVRFHWGTFIFDGNIHSVSETIDFFSEQGVALRSTVKLAMIEVESKRGNPAVLAGVGASAGIGLSASVGVSAGIEAGFSASASLSAGIDIGTTPLTLAQAGDSVQALAGRAGLDVSWKAIAAANNIDNPRLLQPGTPLHLNVRASASASANFSANS